MRRLLPLLALLLAADARAAADHLTWIAVDPDAPYTTKSHHALIVDPWNDRLVAVGHFQFDTRDPLARPLAGPSWSPIDTAGGPYIGADVYTLGVIDTVRRRMLILEQPLFDSPAPAAWTLLLDGTDTWAAFAPPGAGPPAVQAAAMAADLGRDRLLLFGGHELQSPNPGNGVWMVPLSGADGWTPLTTSGAAPDPRTSAAVAFDPARDRLLVFGGSGSAGALADTWQLGFADGPAWQQLATVRSPQPWGSPLATWDAASDRMLAFTGTDVWELAPSSEWFARRPAAPGGTPDARVGGALASDARSGKTYLFGGVTGFRHQPTIDPTLWVLVREPAAALGVESPGTVTFFRGQEVRIPFTIVNPGAAGAFAWTLSSSPTVTGLPASGVASAAANDLVGFDVPLTVTQSTPVSFTLTLRLHATGNPADSAVTTLTLARDATDAVDDAAGHTRFAVWQNPTRGAMRFAIELAAPASLAIDVFDLTGRRVARRAAAPFAAGSHRLILGETASLRDGVYFARLSVGSRTLTNRVVLVR